MACGVPLGELKVGAGALGLCFDGCRQIILCGLRVADAQVFSVARPVVEPKIARELLIESIALGLTGGVFAIGVAYAGLRLLVAVGPANLPRVSEISLDARALGFTLLYRKGDPMQNAGSAVLPDAESETTKASRHARGRG